MGRRCIALHTYLNMRISLYISDNYHSLSRRRQIKADHETSSTTGFMTATI